MKISEMISLLLPFSSVFLCLMFLAALKVYLMVRSQLRRKARMQWAIERAAIARRNLECADTYRAELSKAIESGNRFGVEMYRGLIAAAESEARMWATMSYESNIGEAP